MEQALCLCEKKIGYKFKNRSLLAEALTHASVRSSAGRCNERLEFLGDSAISLAVSEYVYKTYRDKTEGELTQIRSYLVSRRVLARAGRRLELDSLAAIGKGVTSQKRVPMSIMANLYEAVAGAIYLDGGIEPVKDFILRTLKQELDEMTDFRDYKSKLQEISQRLWDVIPVYTVVHESGPPHQKSFKVLASINGVTYGEGEGSTKKEAEQQSAFQALRALKNERKVESEGK